jgi:GT2 family glycosyltransferase
MKPLISIIIPTYKRSKYLVKLVNNLITNNINFKYFEIIICDSDKQKINYKLIKNIKCNYKNVQIKYLNLLENNHSKKRNIGIKRASSKFLIFLDDDCIPEKKFISKYFQILSKQKDKAIFCGSVIYPENSNRFHKFREKRHFQVFNKQVLKENISPEKIVTMNMAFDLTKIDKKKLFNEKFNFYGFEDYDFAYRQSKSGIKIYKCAPLVVHNDYRSYEKYLYKFVFLGEEGMKYLLKLNLEAAKNINYYKLENNLIIKHFLKQNYTYVFLNYIMKVIINLEKKLILPFFVLKLGIIFSYLLGSFLRKHINIRKKLLKNSWYV